MATLGTWEMGVACPLSGVADDWRCPTAPVSSVTSKAHLACNVLAPLRCM
eukprot:CAMPEP_0181203888 /NCGR_PEP_ID=MMETSP1096-20121128/19637_1 /TAXON_ID=156174 ORGANISM="Chrysochromulina ericina, Strain CCMP281" /NCGR_SAMPLE_ID=MMETSP1096 /ASSEMBLY_ACC=CAM_ASM_000453 /LENGTH=49 /DNA_ID=CAMNT_0023294541 /DNA_START=107 /DNA_END=256 /DNA_ORIENTATION=-